MFFVFLPITGALAHKAGARTHHLSGYGPELKAGSETDDPPPSFIRGRTSVRVGTPRQHKACQNPAHTEPAR